MLVGVQQATSGHAVTAFWLFVVSMLLDAVDGWLARRLGQVRMGQELARHALLQPATGSIWHTCAGGATCISLLATRSDYLSQTTVPVQYNTYPSGKDKVHHTNILVGAHEYPCLCCVACMQATSFGALLDVILDILLRGWLWVNALPAAVALLLPLLEMMVFAITHKVCLGFCCMGAQAYAPYSKPHMLLVGSPKRISTRSKDSLKTFFLQAVGGKRPLLYASAQARMTAVIMQAPRDPHATCLAALFCAVLCRALPCCSDNRCLVPSGRCHFLQLPQLG